MKRISYLIVVVFVLFALKQNAFALPIRIGLCLSGFNATYTNYLEALHESISYPMDPTYGLDLSLSLPFSDNFDLQFGGACFVRTKMKRETLSDGFVYLSDAYVNLRLIGPPVSSLGGFQPYAGIGLCYGFVTLKDIEESGPPLHSIPLHSDLGYQVFIGGYIAKDFLVEIGCVRLNMKGPEVTDVYLSSGVYIKGGYAFNILPL